MSPQRIHWSRFLGTPLPKTARLITRAGRWGNPFPGCEHRTREQAIEQFRQLLARPDRTVDPAWLCPCDPERQMQRAARYPSLADLRRALAGYDLACACQPGKPCHGDILLALLYPTNGANTMTTTAQGAR